MCEPINSLTVETWAAEVERLSVTLYLLTQIIRIASPELKEMQTDLMLHFAAQKDDGGFDGINTKIDNFVGAVKAKAAERQSVIVELLTARAL